MLTTHATNASIDLLAQPAAPRILGGEYDRDGLLHDRRPPTAEEREQRRREAEERDRVFSESAYAGTAQAQAARALESRAHITKLVHEAEHARTRHARLVASIELGRVSLADVVAEIDSAKRKVLADRDPRDQREAVKHLRELEADADVLRLRIDVLEAQIDAERARVTTDEFRRDEARFAEIESAISEGAIDESTKPVLARLRRCAKEIALAQTELASAALAANVLLAERDTVARRLDLRAPTRALYAADDAIAIVEAFLAEISK